MEVKKDDLYLYDYGLPFGNKLAQNIDDLLDRIDRKKASLLIIDGLMGEGKTTLAVEIMEYVTKSRDKAISTVGFYDDFKTDFEKQLAMGGEDFQEKLQICRDSKLVVLTYDEAGDFSKRGAITSFNQRLIRVFQTFRSFKILIIMCLPSFEVLDNDLFKHGVPRLLLHCCDRGQTYGSIKGYGLEEMFYIKHFMKKEVVPLKAYSKINPNFRSHFKDLPKAISNKLDKISTAAKSETLSSNILKNQGLLNKHDIAKIVGRSIRWVEKGIAKTDVTHKRIFKRAKYYGEEVISILEAQIGDSKE
jgi:Ni2+-binding GTPase involved in maturation of urease and hydrogenase